MAGYLIMFIISFVLFSATYAQYERKIMWWLEKCADYQYKTLPLSHSNDPTERLKSLNPSLRSDVSPFTNVSIPCAESSSTIFAALIFQIEDYVPFVCPLLDAMAKPGADLFKGNIVMTGGRQTCENIHFNDSEFAFNGRMFGLSVTPFKNPDCDNPFQVRYEFCWVDNCTEADLQQVVKNVKPQWVDAVCGIKKAVVAVYVLFVSIISFVTMLVINCTDCNIDDNLCNAAWVKCIVPFSAPLNIIALVKPVESQPKCVPINMITVIFMTWLISGEAGLIYTFYGRNQLDMMQSIRENVVLQAILNFFLSVDSILFLIGLKMSSELRNGWQIKKQITGLNIRGMITFLSREISTTISVYIFVILVYTFIIEPFYALYFPLVVTEETCKDDFWKNLACSSNFLGKCLTNTWLVSTVVQCLLVLPFFYVALLIPRIQRCSSLSVCVFIITTSIASTFVLIYVKDLPPVFLTGYNVLHARKSRVFETFVMKAPWSRIQGIAFGILVGVSGILEINPFNNLNSVIHNALMIAPIIVPAPVLYAVTALSGSFYKDYTLLSHPYRSIVAAFATPMWLVAVTVVIVTMNWWRGLFRQFLLWNAWSCLAKLSIGAYMWHEIAQNMVVGFALPIFQFMNMIQVTLLLALPTITLSYLLAALTYVLIEAPIRRLHYWGKVKEHTIHIPVNSC